MDFLNLLAISLIATLLVQALAFIYVLKSKRVDFIDVVWGLNFIAAVLFLQILHPSSSLWVIIVDILVLVWGLRLSWHIYRRFKKSNHQDERYTEVIKKWPKQNRSIQMFFKLFALQGLLATIISLPIIAIHTIEPATNIVTITGLFLWIAGFAFELVADSQLRSFLAKPQHGDLMKEGLWRYSRHPNYFGEVVMWWGIALIASQTSFWLLGFVGAMTITILICFISGVPIAEKRSMNKKGWLEYRQRTSVLIPWLPQK